MTGPVLGTVIVVATVLLGIAAACAVWRIIQGPTVLDRVVATDMLLGTLMCGLGVEMVVNQHTTTLPVLIALVLFSVLGSVSVSRYIATSGGGRAEDHGEDSVESGETATGVLDRRDLEDRR
jgi:multicomponent Na+:H+ antiporter subunit F